MERAAPRRGSLVATGDVGAPAAHGFVEAVAKAIELIERADGEAMIFDAVPRGEAMAARLEALFTDERDQEWMEFLAECSSSTRRSTRRSGSRSSPPPSSTRRSRTSNGCADGSANFKARDLFGAPSRRMAERRLKECVEHLEDFAEQVYEHEGGT